MSALLIFASGAVTTFALMAVGVMVGWLIYRAAARRAMGG